MLVYPLGPFGLHSHSAGDHGTDFIYITLLTFIILSNGKDWMHSAFNLFFSYKNLNDL